MMKMNRKGFTLIELLIVVAIIGIIAAIAIPNLLNAIQRGKQKRTMADMRAIATSAEAYAVDNNLYPAAAYSAIATTQVSAITTSLSPTYIKECPRTTAGFVRSCMGRSTRTSPTRFAPWARTAPRTPRSAARPPISTPTSFSRTADSRCGPRAFSSSSRFS